MKKHNQTLVVNLPMINSTICQKIILQDVAPQLQKTRISKKNTRKYLSQESKFCYNQMRVKRPLFISFSWPLIKIWSLKTTEKADFYNMSLFVTLHAKNAKSELKMGTSGPYRGDVGPFMA